MACPLRITRPLGASSASRAGGSWVKPGTAQRTLLPPARVLQREPGTQADDEAAMARARNAIARLLGPSLSALPDLGETPSPSPTPPLAPSPLPLAPPAAAPPAAAAAVEEGCVYHFAYGANMAFSTLARRDVRPLSRDAAMVVDPSIRIRFRHRGGYSTLESMPADGSISVSSSIDEQQQQQQQIARPRYPPFNARVHGVLYKLRKEDMAKLVKKEGGYVIRDIEVETYDGRHVMAQTFVSGPMATLAAEVAPTEKYMRALREGAAENYLDPLHQAWLSGIETVSSAGLGPEYFETPSKLVAYGFLAVTALLFVGFFVQH